MTYQPYEIHVTLLEDDPAEHIGWSNSAYDGDPTLGKGKRYYRTAHAETAEEAAARIEDAHQFWPKAVRFKVEKTVYDELHGGRVTLGYDSGEENTDAP